MSFVKQLRGIVKTVVPYVVEARHIRRRYGRVDITDAIGEFDLPRCVRWILCLLPYGLTKAWLTRRFCPVDWRSHQAAFPATVARLSAKIRSGERLKTLFLVSDAAMFAAEPLYRALSLDPLFTSSIVVIPDFRRLPTTVELAMDRCADELRAKYATGRVLKLRRDPAGVWPDVVREADLVSYPLPYDFSHRKYSIRHSAGLDVLPVLVNYGFYRSLYDRETMGTENYAHLWRVFFECDATMREYATCSLTRGCNAALTGYVKMDGLSSATAEPHERKRILVALHHSVEGGVNQTLSLANFVRYADFFLALPEKFPEIDFVFRPHPFLFQIVSRPNVWGPKHTAAYIAELKRKPNVIWSDGGDYFREFAESDGCIQDCGSFLVEYVYTGKPCCYMLKSPNDINEKFVQLGKDCLEQCYIAYATADIESFVRNVIVAGFDPKANARKAFAKTVMVNYPCASQVALEHIKKSLIG